MITFHTSAEVTEDRRVLVTLPPDAPLGSVELEITIAQSTTPRQRRGNVRRLFGTINSGDPNSADNDRIDEDLAREADAK